MWETKEQVRLGRFTPAGKPIGEPQSMPGEEKGRKHPAVAANSQGAFVVAWAEGTGWNKGGSVAWQVFDPDGKPVPGRSGHAEGMPAWDKPAVIVCPDGTFKIMF